MTTLAGNYRTPPMLCPYCGKKIEAATAMTDDDTGVVRGITPNCDVSLCAYCGEWIIMNQAGTGWRKPTDNEHIKLGLDRRTSTLRTAWLMTGGSWDRPVQGLPEIMRRERKR